MKNSKRIRRNLKNLEEIYSYLQYYMHSIPSDLRKNFNDLHNLIEELGIDQKRNNARLAKKLKYLWEHKEEDKDDDKHGNYDEHLL